MSRRGDHPGFPTEEGLTLEEAYALQDQAIEGSGELVVGAVVAWWGPGQVAFGWLTDAIWLAPEQPVATSELGAAQVAPQLVYRLRTDLEGTGITATDALGATAAVTGGLVVLRSPGEAAGPSSRADAVADNLGTARFVVGETWVDPRLVDLGLAGCLVEVDGEVVASAAGAALGGQPAQGVAELANHLGQRGQLLPAGSIVVVGNLTGPLSLPAGSSMTATYAHLGSVTVRAVP